MSSFSLFAYERGEDEAAPLRRERLPHARLEHAVSWALGRGCDSILIELHDAKPFHPAIVHHVCADPVCPGGC